MRFCLLLLLTWLPGVPVGAGDDSADSLKLAAHRLSLPAGSPVDAQSFANRASVKELIIADEAALPILEEVLTGDADWSAKASAIYVLWRNAKLRYIGQNTASDLFANGSPELRPFAAAVIRFAYAESVTSDDAAMKWWLERAEAQDPCIDKVAALLDARPEWTPEEAQRRIDILLPAVLQSGGKGPDEFVGHREIPLISELGSIAVPSLSSALARAGDERVKKRLLCALGQTKSADAAERLRGFLHDPSESIRGTALLAYKWCVGAAALPELRCAVASDPSPLVRGWAEDYVNELTKDNAPPSPGDNVLHPTPGEWLEAHRDLAIAETRKQNAPLARAVQDALEKAHTKKPTTSIPVASETSRPSPHPSDVRWEVIATIALSTLGAIAVLMAVLVRRR